MKHQEQHAPGQPGLPPRWTSSTKDGVGTAIGRKSPLWFTLHQGVVGETYYPRVDSAALRDFEFLVTDGSDFFSEEKCDTSHEIEPLATGVPGWKVTNTCKNKRYRITKTIITDPSEPTLLMQVAFEALEGKIEDFHLYALIAPHLGDQGTDNSASIEKIEGNHLLLAQHDDACLALACSVPFLNYSCGYMGVSDGWQDIHEHHRLTTSYSEAPEGNVVLTGEIDLNRCERKFIIAIGFGDSKTEAMQRALVGSSGDFDERAETYSKEWQAFQAHCEDMDDTADAGFYRMSAAVLKTHDSKERLGGMVASLSIPWGFAHGDKDLGGYHLVWPRDQVEGAGALLAAGDVDDARKALEFLIHTQHDDGRWPQNMWVSGKAYWHGVQVDETALPILLADSLRRRNGLAKLDCWPAVRRAASFLVRRGPSSPQDRWEENAGYSPFTLAVSVAALLAAADFADDAGDSDAAQYWRETADSWNESIERWTYAEDTDLAKRVGVDGYYVRISPPSVTDQGGPANVSISLKNRSSGQDTFPAAEIVSPDALALVRYGLRAPDDPRILNTLKIIDATLRSELQTGPGWHRYTNDGYGETEDGGPFQGTGVGRCWPLLAGERAHYELAAGNHDEAKRILQTLIRQTSPGKMLPEQVWDADDIPERGLRNGHPTGSGMPLVWAHAECVKLFRSLRDGEVWDCLPQTVTRYLKNKTPSRVGLWRFSDQPKKIKSGQVLRLELDAPGLVRWSGDAWKTVQDVTARDTGFGIFAADLATDTLKDGAEVQFTFCWTQSGRWEGRNFIVAVSG